MWNVLFAQAADVGSTTTAREKEDDEQAPSPSAPQSQVMVVDKTTTGSRKGKKRRRVLLPNHDNVPEYIQMVENRIRSVPPGTAGPPHGWILGGSFLSDSSSSGTKSCGGWKTPVTDSTKCLNCGKLALYHHLEVPSSSIDDDDGYRLFQWIRNLRCAAGISVVAAATSLSPPRTNDLRDELDGQSSALHRSMPSILQRLTRDEADILSPKIQAVVDLARLLRQSLFSSDGSRDRRRANQLASSTNHPGICRHWEPAIRLITACDTVYYRMYYLQLTQAIPPCRYNERPCFFPNPLEYFQLVGLTFLHSNTIIKKEGELLSDTDDPSTTRRKHPLEQIHRLRQLETMTLFGNSGWLSSPHATSATLMSLNHRPRDDDPESHYQTPAAEVQMEWRDGCRDFLCNLYSFATVSTCVLDRIASFCTTTTMNQAHVVGGGIVEIGAGTGYLAKLLQDKGLAVEPWDLQPPSSSSPEGAAATINEYHGQTPTFVTVGKRSRLPHTSCRNKALMLCYPPPGSSMASDTLKEYLRHGGSCLIHIGEFKGLTGDSVFEALLTKNMSCYVREPCLTWGTDASHVTIWMKDDVAVHGSGSRPEGSKVLLPCSRCQRQEAIKVCRVERNLVYCSPTCFEEDTLRIEESFKRHCIPLRSTDLQYTNDRHFSKL